MLSKRVESDSGEVVIGKTISLGYFTQENVGFDENIINSLKEDVVNVHEVVPNYLRKANS